jgi:hypothetical protein
MHVLRVMPIEVCDAPRVTASVLVLICNVRWSIYISQKRHNPRNRGGWRLACLATQKAAPPASRATPHTPCCHVQA